MGRGGARDHGRIAGPFRAPVALLIAAAGPATDRLRRRSDPADPPATAAPQKGIHPLTHHSPSHPFGGVYASTICPMHEDGRIDHAALERHLADIAAVEGMAGFLLNGHAGENHALERDEFGAVVRAARSVAPGKRIVAGVNGERSDMAALLARDAVDAGADAVMAFPPYSWALGADDRVIQGHHRTIAKACGAPIFLFQGSVNAGRTHFRPDTLKRLLEIDSVTGIKEGSWESAAYEATRRLTRSLRPDVGVMASGDEHLFVCFALGSEGSLVSLAAIVPELIVALERAVAAGDMAAARAVHDRLYPLARRVYAAPGHLAALRLKTCLKLMGRLASVSVRAPIAALSDLEIAQLREALTAAGVLEPRPLPMRHAGRADIAR